MFPPIYITPSGIVGSTAVGRALLTSTALADPNADRIVFWDDSAGDFVYLTAGTGLSISGTTLTNTVDVSPYLPLAGGTLIGDLKFTDALYDIGKSGATRPRDIFTSRHVTAGGNVVSDQHNFVSGTGYFAVGATVVNFRGTTQYFDPSGNLSDAIRLTASAFEPYSTSTFHIGGASTRFQTGYFITGNFSGVVFVGVFTVATLPAASSNDGATARVTDSSVAMLPANYGATVAGGGANKVRVFSDGTNWIIA